MNSRLSSIRLAPLSWKEVDVLTAAEKYLSHTMEISMIEMIKPCFADVNNKAQNRIEQVWHCLSASWHLETYDIYFDPDEINCELRSKAAHLYQQEAQRLLGSLFDLDHAFWNVFYKRQEESIDKMLSAVDALYHTSSQNQIAYQLIIQTLKSTIQGYYNLDQSQHDHYLKALGLIGDLPLPALRSWITDQVRHSQNGDKKRLVRRGDYRHTWRDYSNYKS